MSNDSEENVKPIGQTLQWLEQLELNNFIGYDPEFNFLVKVINNPALLGRRIEITGGSEIKEFCQNVVNFEKQIGEPVVGIFNDVELYCNMDTLPGELMDSYEDILNHQNLE